MRSLKAFCIAIVLWSPFCSLPTLHAQATSCDFNSVWTVTMNGEMCLTLSNAPHSTTCYPYQFALPFTFTHVVPGAEVVSGSAPAPEDSSRTYPLFRTSNSQSPWRWFFPLFRSPECGGQFAGWIGGPLTATIPDCNTMHLALSTDVSDDLLGLHAKPPDCFVPVLAVMQRAYIYLYDIPVAVLVGRHAAHSGLPGTRASQQLKPYSHRTGWDSEDIP
jgi:hypothetical protein